MSDLHTITINLDEIRTRAEAIAHVRLNRTKTSEDELRMTLYQLERAVDECRLAEYALKVELQKTEQAMADAGYDATAMSDASPLARHMTVFREYAETFTRRVRAIERVLEERRDLSSEPDT